VNQPTISQGHALPGRPEQWATRLAFFFIGVALATWAPLVPFAKQRSGLDDGGLGLLLLCLGAGSILAMPLSGALATRIGCRAVILLSGLALTALLPLLAFLDDALLLGVTLFIFGGAVGASEVAMNIQAVIVEKGSTRPLMSGFHGCFSVGGFAGAGCVSALLWLGMTPLATTLLIGLGLVATLLLSSRNNLTYGNEGGERSPMFVMPRGIVLFIGLLCFIIFLAEGAMLDWSALFLETQRGFDRALSGTGYTAFAIAMTLGRFGGDRIVAALGPYRVMLLGGLVVTLGFAVAVLVPFDAASLIGFALIGLGASNIVPVLYTATGAQKVMSPSHAVAAITTIGYAGILLGPAVIGFVAKASSLSLAFGLIGLLVLSIAASARRVTGPRPSESR
jgi:predicted MFS family arabinose efflux permease